MEQFWYGYSYRQLIQQIYSSFDYSLVKTLHKHTLAVECLAWGLSDKDLVSGSMDKTLVLWDVNKGASRTVLKSHTKPVKA